MLSLPQLTGLIDLRSKYNLKGDNVILIKLLCFWTLSIVLSSFKTHFSGTGVCLRLQVEPTHLGPIDKASPYLRTLEPT
jgi:hypothetical protein